MEREYRVLIIEDDKHIHEFMAVSLQKSNYMVLSAYSATEGMFMFSSHKPDLVLLDLRMPGMGGLEALRRIRSSSLKTSVIIITAFGTVDAAVEAMKLGAVDFLQKPFSPQELRSLVERVLARDSLAVERAESYEDHVEIAKRAIRTREFQLGIDHLRQAIAKDPGRAEAFNLLGAVHEITGELSSALGHYRAALAVDPTFEPARANLHRVVTTGAGEIALGNGPGQPDRGRPADVPEGEEQ